MLYSTTTESAAQQALTGQQVHTGAVVLRWSKVSKAGPYPGSYGVLQGNTRSTQTLVGGLYVGHYIPLRNTQRSRGAPRHSLREPRGVARYQA